MKSSSQPVGGYDPVFFGTVGGAERRHFWFLHRRRVVSRLVRQALVGRDQKARVLEVGCGSGHNLVPIRKVVLDGLLAGADRHLAAASRVARQCPGLTSLVADVRDLPFVGQFDIVLMLDVLEHLEDDAEALSEVRSVLVDGGRLVITVPAHAWLWSAVDEVSGHVRRYSTTGLRGTLQAAGFSVDYLSPFMSLLLPPLLGTRKLFPARQGQGPGERERIVARDLRVIPLLNRVVCGLLALELWPLANGWRVPFGASLCAIASPHGEGREA